MANIRRPVFLSAKRSIDLYIDSKSIVIRLFTLYTVGVLKYFITSFSSQARNIAVYVEFRNSDEEQAKPIKVNSPEGPSYFVYFTKG